ncbi:hypothetical protein BH11BAC1_BH11BAC1_21690 [soil metagenome]
MKILTVIHTLDTWSEQRFYRSVHEFSQQVNFPPKFTQSGFFLFFSRPKTGHFKPFITASVYSTTSKPSMKIRYTFISALFFAFISLMILDASNNEANSHQNGSPATRTGSPGDGGATCKNCHSGPTPTTQAGMITSNIPVAGYTGGQTYTITATVSRSGHSKFGFEISPQNITGTQLGTLIVTNTTEMQLVGSGKYITQKTAGTAGTNSRTWLFNWTAPATGTGNVTFFGAFNITNSGNNSSGDTTVLSTLVVSECSAPAQTGAITGSAVFCSASGVLTYSVPPVAGATSYNWTVPAGWTIISTPPYTNTIQVLPGSSQGNITVSATNSCGTSPVSTLAVSIDNLSLSILSTNISCNGGNNGTATGVPSSGVAPYTYLWSGGQTTSTISSLGVGSYTAIVTDGAGCSSSSSTPVTQPSAISLNTSSASSHCGNADGSATVVANGGTQGYTYSWNTIPVQTTVIASNLLQGNYTVTVTDANSCSASATIGINSIAGPSPNIVINANVSCHNGNDGVAQANVNGGSAPFTFQWFPAGGTDSIAHSLHAGAYTVIVTDAYGCTGSSVVTVTEPTAIVLTTTTSDAGCAQANGTATVSANGGAGGYLYNWNTIPVQTTATAVNLLAGSYNISVTDGNGCTETATIGVNNTTGPILVAGTVTDATCFDANDGELSVLVNSGNGPYSYQWLPSGGTDTLARNLHAGAYSVTVTDAMGCVSVLTGTVNEPPALVADAGFNTSICNGESVILGNSPVASGGTPGYTFLWSPSADLSSATDSMPYATPANTTNYLLIITDAHGCADSANVTVTLYPTPLVPVISLISDSLTSTVASFYQWYLNGIILNGINDQWCIPNQDGIYSVVITDGSGCTSSSAGFIFDKVNENATDAFTLTISPNPAGGYISIGSRTLSKGDTQISIYDLLGNKMLAPVQTINAGKAIVNVSNLSPAIYIVEISSGEKMWRGKFVKR